MLIPALFILASVIISMLLGKCIASTKDIRTRVAVVIGSLALWTACVWLLILYWRGAFEQ